MDIIQTHPKLLKVLSTVTNTVDPRNWVFTIALYFLDLAINTSSIYFVFGEEWPAVSCMLLGLFFMACEIPFIGFYFRYAYEQKKQVYKVFVKLDADEDGQLTREETEKLMAELPKETFSVPFSERVEMYSMDNLMWCHNQPRMFTFRFLEFSVAWLMFFASLMLIEPGQPITAIVAVQGVASVIGLMLVLSDFFDNYFRKYHSKKAILRYSCMFLYGLTLLTIFAVLLSGYAFVTLIYNGRYEWPAVHVNTTAVPQEDLVGFVTGWILSAFVVAAFLVLALLNCCCVQCGQIEVEIAHVGSDDPIKLLGGKAIKVLRKSDVRKEPQAGQVLGDSAKAANNVQEQQSFLVEEPTPIMKREYGAMAQV